MNRRGRGRGGKRNSGGWNEPRGGGCRRTIPPPHLATLASAISGGRHLGRRSGPAFGDSDRRVTRAGRVREEQE
ncbi:hypothetical protein EYF80_028069 [Liparis tanakae]|uniref:Uncharacterized protein n=1 Tax=Liparis tanakae TaxID=230148 RepID=A0A4Z2H713_9TELE|nr:hypothetical protein EYF80_028069 [Liparis tanakae]